MCFLTSLFPVKLKQVKRGTPYAFCNGTIPTADQLCEPGALAFEFSLAGVNATLEDANNVTQHIVACPRPDCLVGTPCSKVVSWGRCLYHRTTHFNVA